MLTELVGTVRGGGGVRIQRTPEKLWNVGIANHG
jgi:hypothetical protein